MRPKFLGAVLLAGAIALGGAGVATADTPDGAAATDALSAIAPGASAGLPVLGQLPLSGGSLPGLGGGLPLLG